MTAHDPHPEYRLRVKAIRKGGAVVPSDPRPEGMEGEITYDLETVNTLDVVPAGLLTNARPLNRPSYTVEIRAAGVGDRMLGELHQASPFLRVYQMSESLPFDECEPPPRPAGGIIRRVLGGLGL